MRCIGEVDPRLTCRDVLMVRLRILTPAKNKTFLAVSLLRDSATDGAGISGPHGQHVGMIRDYLHEKDTVPTRLAHTQLLHLWVVDIVGSSLTIDILWENINVFPNCLFEKNCVFKHVKKRASAYSWKVLSPTHTVCIASFDVWQSTLVHFNSRILYSSLKWQFEASKQSTHTVHSHTRVLTPFKVQYNLGVLSVWRGRCRLHIQC